MLTKENIEDIYPLSPMQEGMLFHWLHDGGANFYFEQFTFKIEGELNVNYVQESVKILMQRYDILRTVFNFKRVAEQPLQVVLKSREINFYYEDLRCLNLFLQDQFVEDYLIKDRSRSFDLSRDVLMRVSVLQRSEYEYDFIWSYHHILMDGWCMDILLPEYNEIYTSLVEGRAYHLPVAKQYKTYIQWLLQQDSQKAKDYWLDYLSRYEQVADLPRRVSFTKKLENPTLQSLQLGKIKSDRLRALSRQYQVSLNTILEVLWGVLLGKYGNRQDVVFGSVVSGRPATLEGVERMVGLFINTIPIRIAFEDQTTLIDLVIKRQEEALQSSNYQYSSLADIQASSLLGSNLINHIMVFQNVPTENQNKPQICEKPFTVIDTLCFEQTNYDLTITIIPSDDILIRFSFNDSAYDPHTLLRVQQHFLQLVDHLTDNELQRISKLSILSLKENEHLAAFNQTDVTYDYDCSILEMFYDQLQIKADSLAICGERGVLTYSQLHRQSNHIANLLIEEGYVDCNVAVLMSHGIEYVVAFMAIMKVGGTVVPMDSEWPTERIQYIVDSLGKTVILADENASHHLEGLSYFSLTVKYGDCPESTELSKLKLTKNRPLYIIHTSGSTGYPKGVMVSQRGIQNRLFWMNDYFGKNAAQRVLCTTKHIFDSSIWQILWPLINGGALVFPELNAILDKGYFEGLTRKYRLTLTDFVPSLFKYIINDLSETSNNNLASLTDIIIGGEAIDVKACNEFKKRFPSIRITNLYGPTEASIGCVYYSVTKDNYTDIPIGKPLSNTKIFILDKNLNQVPIGVSGDICISGTCLADGYWNDREKTDLSFIPHPFISGERLYKTGDLGYWQPDGNIIYLGRVDDQVKIHGYRIELKELDSILLECSAILGCVTVSKRIKDQDCLVSYYQVKPDVEIQKASLRRYLNDKLPQYMVPTYLIRLDSFPLTASGKIDKKQLPHPVDMAEGAQCYTAPQTPLQQQLVAIWEALLGHSPVGIDDNFFELGGHSLRAIRLVSRLGRDIGKSVGVGEIFRHPTIRMLSERLAGEPTVVTAAIPRAGEASSYPLSHAQQRLWLIEQLEGESVAYNIFGVYKLRGEVSMVGMAEAFRRVVDRHESLRTRLITEEGAPRQQVVSVDEIGYQFDYQDLRSMTDAEQVLQQLVEEEGSSRFDLGTGPLLRTKLVRLGEEQYYFLLSLHHIIADGWSMEVLVREVLQYYQGYIEGQGVELPPLAIQYKDYAVWQRQALQETSYQSARRYWLEQFKGPLPMLDFPTDYPRPRFRSYDGASVGIKLNEKIKSKLLSFSQREGVSLFMTLLSSVYTLLHRYTGNEDIIIGSPMADREHADLENQIGFYVNTLALRTHINPEDTFKTLLHQVKQMTLNAYEHQHYPFDKLVEDLGLAKDLDRHPLFDVMVLLQQNSDTDRAHTISQSKVKVSTYPVNITTAKFDMTFVFCENEEDIELMLLYRKDLYAPERMSRMLYHYVRLVNLLVDNPNQPICTYQYLSEQERDQLLSGVSQFNLEAVGKPTILDIFSKCVSEKADSLALIYGNAQLTYQELDEYSDKYAQYLSSNYHIKPGDRVVVLLDRSIELVVVLFSLLKLRAVFIPFDIQWPFGRITTVLSLANAQLTVTTDKFASKLAPSFPQVSIIALQAVAAYTTRISSINSAQDSDLAYILFTSGSTGTPKGVMVSQVSLANYVTWSNRYYFRDQADSPCALYTSVAFDLTLTSIFTTLLRGDILHIYDQSWSALEALKSIFNSNTSVQSVKLTPSHIQLLPSQAEQATNVKTVIVGGEPLHIEHVSLLREMDEKMRIYNEYGPTETCIGCSVFEVSVTRAMQIPIGRPIANMQLYVLDGQEQLVPIGVMGEICIAGVGVSRGYLHQEELSRAKFRKNPYPGGETLYHSGDLGYWDEAGQLVYVGRIDEQVKLRGYRIEPGEVAMMMEQHPEVRTAVVTIGAHAAQQNLVGYYQASSVIEEEELRGYLSEQLPGYMVPTYLIRLDSFPLTASGKIDKKQLPDPVGMGLGQREYVAPQSEVEKVVVRVWEEVLGRQGIGLQDNFFELGGDSIKAIQLCSRLFRQGYKLEVKDIFRHLTIAGVSSVAQPAISCQPIDQGVVVGEVLLTPIQQAFFSWGLKAAHHYNQAQLLYRQQGFDPEAIRAVFKQLQTHHDALRMTYSRQQGHWRQWNEDATHPLALFIYDLREAKDAVGQLTELGTQLQSGMNLESGPLLQLGLFHMPDGDRLLIAIHHLVVDGVSWRILLEDIAILLQQYHQGEVLELSAKTSSFQQWSASLHRYSQSEAFKQEFSYWESVEAEGAQVERLRKDDGGVSLGRVGASRQVSFQLSEEETISLLTRCHQAFGTEINDLLLTGLGMGLFEVFGGQKVLLMLEGHGREGVVGGVDVTRTVGWFTSMYPVVLDMGYGQELGRQIKEVKERLRKVPHKGIGYGLYKYHKRQLTVGEWLGAEMSFNYLGQYEGGMLEGGQFGLASESGGASQSVENQRQFAIDITGLVIDNELNVGITYHKNQFEESFIEAFADQFEEGLQQIIALCIDHEKELSPTDLTYNELSIDQLDKISNLFNNS